MRAGSFKRAADFVQQGWASLTARSVRGPIAVTPEEISRRIYAAPAATAQEILAAFGGVKLRQKD